MEPGFASAPRERETATLAGRPHFMALHFAPRCRSGVTLLELLVVLVLLGMAAALVVPSIRFAVRDTAGTSLERARAVAVRRGQSVRMTVSETGAWSVAATADTAGVILLSGTGDQASGSGVARSVVISALGLCMPEGPVVVGTPPWDPARCRPAR